MPEKQFNPTYPNAVSESALNRKQMPQLFVRDGSASHDHGEDERFKTRGNYALDIPVLYTDTIDSSAGGGPIAISDDLAITGDLSITGDATITGTMDSEDYWHIVGAAGEPGFNNGWANYGAPYPLLQFKKTATGLLIITGLIRWGDTAPAFYLPTSHTPNSTYHIATATSEGFGVVRINSGTITHEVTCPNVSTGWCNVHVIVPMVL